jgi:hypothetical protein
LTTAGPCDRQASAVQGDFRAPRSHSNIHTIGLANMTPWSGGGQATPSK